MRGAQVAMCLLIVATAGCAAHHSSPDIVSAGQIDIQLPPGWKVTHNGAQAPPTAAAPSVAAGTATSSPTTAAGAIPLAKANPITAFFQATNSFTGCLKGLGVKFIGAPDPKNPSSPTNDPAYLKNLSTCAAQSGIVQALKDFQTSQNNLTPAQIQQQNKGYLAWRQCMIGRGWTIPQPKPDAQGRLFSFSGTGGGGPQLTPPAGQDVLTSSDIRDCAAQVTPASGTAGS